MSSSPALQPQRGAGGKSVADETAIEVVVDELADETAVEDEAIACKVVTAGDDVGKSCDVQLPGDMVESFCNVETIVDVWSSSDSESTGISEKSRLGNRREFRPENRRELRLSDLTEKRAAFRLCGLVENTGPGSCPRVLPWVPVPCVVW